MAWSLKYEHCIECGTTGVKHKAKGLCSTCYNRMYELTRETKGPRYRVRGEISEILTYEFLIEEYIQKQRSLSDIARDLNCSRQFVSMSLRKFNIPARTQKMARIKALQQGKIQYLREDSEGKIQSVTHTRTTCNERFFKVWSPEMAYVLGVIITDGFIYPSSENDPKGKSTATVSRLSIAQKEPELLEKVLALLRCNAKLHYQNRKEYASGISGERFYFNIYSDKIYSDLLCLGITPRKSKTILFPDVPPEHLMHFMRGCWDGDGGIWYEEKRDNYFASFTSGSRAFIEVFESHLVKAGLPKRRIYSRNNAFDIRYSGNACSTLFEILYKDAPEGMYLSKKWELFYGAYLHQRYDRDHLYTLLREREKRLRNTRAN